MRFAIKTAAPSAEAAPFWGDTSFAVSLSKALNRRGHDARVDAVPDWYGPHASLDQAVIVLRGLRAYQPSHRHLNIIWHISHPDDFGAEEAAAYDIIFVASSLRAKELSLSIGRDVKTLLQCTDEEMFRPLGISKENKAVFVGNTRGVTRRVVTEFPARKYALEVIGGGWENSIPSGARMGPVYVPYSDLGAIYSSCKVVLNDHWEDMGRKGFINNRVFDAVASGSFVVSDHVPGIKEIFGSAVATYRTRKEYRSALNTAFGGSVSESEILKVSAAIRSEHTFARRVDDILRAISVF